MRFLVSSFRERARARALLSGLLPLLLAVAPKAAWAAPPQSIDFNVSPNAIAAGYAARVSDSGFGFDLYGLHHTRRANVFGAGLALHANADPGGPPVRVSLGVRALAVDSFFVHHTGGAVGFRLGVRYVVPQYNRIGFGGSVIYAPNDNLAFAGGTWHRLPPLPAAAFAAALRRAGVRVTFRRELGGEIDAACGQLRRRALAADGVARHQEGSPQPAKRGLGLPRAAR